MTLPALPSPWARSESPGSGNGTGARRKGDARKGYHAQGVCLSHNHCSCSRNRVREFRLHNSGAGAHDRLPAGHLLYDPLLHAGSGVTKRFSIVGVTEGCEVKLGADCEDVEEAARPGRRGALGSEV
jgi:hypothetical protein